LTRPVENVVLALLVALLLQLEAHDLVSHEPSCLDQLWELLVPEVGQNVFRVIADPGVKKRARVD